jgi:hypothetical protein
MTTFFKAKNIGILVLATIASSANASFVDSFATAAVPGGAGAAWTPISGSLFAERQLQRFNSSATTAIPAGGPWTYNMPASGTYSVLLNYREDNSGSTIDLSGIASMSLDFAGVTGSTSLNWVFVDDADINAYFATNPTITTNGTVTFDMSTAALDDPGFAWNKVKSMSLILSKATAAASGASVSNFTYAPVPEPATMATLGLGTLAMLRKRRKKA